MQEDHPTMKNTGTFWLVLILCISLAFTAGLFIGRNANHTDISLSSRPTETGTSTETSSQQSSDVITGLININTATCEELQTLPGIGEVIARRIVDYREENGNFQTVQDIAQVDGIGAKRLEAIIDLITVGG